MFNERYVIDAIPGKSILVTRIPTKNQAMMDIPRFFEIGDFAEYDSYNLSYFGRIASITDKTVSIWHSHSCKKSRLKHRDFAARNWNFDEQEAYAKNVNWSD